MAEQAMLEKAEYERILNLHREREEQEHHQHTQKLQLQSQYRDTILAEVKEREKSKAMMKQASMEEGRRLQAMQQAEKDMLEVRDLLTDDG